MSSIFGYIPGTNKYQYKPQKDNKAPASSSTVLVLVLFLRSLVVVVWGFFCPFSCSALSLEIAQNCLKSSMSPYSADCCTAYLIPSKFNSEPSRNLCAVQDFKYQILPGRKKSGFPENFFIQLNITLDICVL